MSLGDDTEETGFSSNIRYDSPVRKVIVFTEDSIEEYIFEKKEDVPRVPIMEKIKSFFR